MATFINDAIQVNRIECDAVVIEKKVSLEYYLFALAVVLVWYGFIVNSYRG